MKKVLFVCTGNTCRSSMAEAIAKRLLEDKKISGEIEFASAGIYAVPGDKASREAVEVMKEEGIDLSSHSARQIGMSLMNEADIILTMTISHKRRLLSMNPDIKNKVFTLKEYVDNKEGDIKDPFGSSVEVYRECARELRIYIEKVLDKLQRNSG